MEKHKDSGNLLPTYEHVSFASSALELCVMQVKYPPVQRFSDISYLTNIKDDIAKDYPLANQERGINILLTPQGVTNEQGAIVHRFNSIDQKWSVLLTNESLSLETREYTSIEDFSSRFGALLHSLTTHFAPRYQLRVGIRYINEFRQKQNDTYRTWSRLLNKDLVASDISTLIDGDVDQTIHEVRIRREDGALLIRHGFLHGTTLLPTPQHPGKNGPFYLLDLDYYDDTPIEFDAKAPLEKLMHYNAFLYRIFRWAIGEDELYTQLRG